MNVDEIKNLDDLIGKKVTGHKVSRLTAPGENYGSLMLSVDISTENEEIKAVAKMIPPNEFIQEIFNTQVTFRNENAFYKTVIPLLQDFQREHGVKEVLDITAEHYGSRLNLKNDDSIVDSDGALILENLKNSGYTTLERLQGLDLTSAKLVLANLAKFHAVPLALRLQKPEVFDKEIKPLLIGFHFKERQLEMVKNDQNNIFEQLPELKPLEDRVMAAFDRFQRRREVRETFATIVHNDCWSNNNMFKLVDGKVVKSKLVDFQIMDYGSPAMDVVFFIYSSVKTEVIKESYEEMLRFYYENFVTTLKELDCDVSEFSYQKFLKEIAIEAKESQCGHLAFMLLPIYATKGSVKEIADLSPDSIAPARINEIQKEKYTFVYNEFAKRNWM